MFPRICLTEKADARLPPKANLRCEIPRGSQLTRTTVSRLFKGSGGPWAQGSAWLLFSRGAQSAEVR